MIIFLDFDGVLHSTESCKLECFGNRLVAADHPDLFQWAPRLWEAIEPHPVQLVIHSSWRLWYEPAELIARFPAYMRRRIVGVTPGGDKYKSIIAYVSAHGIDHYAVLDDMPDAFPPAWPPLIVCDPQTGINDENVLAALRDFLETTC